MDFDYMCVNDKDAIMTCHRLLNVQKDIVYVKLTKHSHVFMGLYDPKI